MNKRPPRTKIAKSRTDRAPKKEPVRDLAHAHPFPIVGLGASAGGLEAIEQFLRHVPLGSGMAYVIVQHLDPSHKGAMVELLQRVTSMPVAQVKDRTKVRADRVYIIPPNRDMSILHGVLHLLEPNNPRGLRLPIDYFFRSLAADREERGIGVILSGMGSDGTLGLRAIKEKAGAVFVQEPSSAKFDGMPRSAIDAGLADVIAPAEDLPGKIVGYLQHAPFVSQPPTLEAKAQSALEKIFILLRAQTGHDFSLYKKNTVHRRIERRMGLHQIPRIADYVRYLRENPQEIEMLFQELLIGVTSFFRDPASWDCLRDAVLPALFAARHDGGILRVWTPGCSTGEEAYSAAIVFRESLERLKAPINVTIQIFATDLDAGAIEKARAGAYPTNIAADVSAERLRRYFVQNEHGYRVSKDIREAVVFATQNVIMDPPFTKLDMVICRNLLIYLDPYLQKKLVPLFHYSLNPGGVLFLGVSETIGGFTDLFAPIEPAVRIYRRTDTHARIEPIDFPASFTATAQRQTETANNGKTEPPVPSLQGQADRVLLQHFSPAAVLTSASGDIVYISGRTGKYLEPAAGKANWNIFAMAREGLRPELHSGFQRAIRQKAATVVKNVRVGSNGDVQLVDVTIQPLTEPPALRGLMMIVFKDLAAPAEGKGKKRASRAAPDDSRAVEIEHESERLRQELQITREEMQTSQEELRSANEELQSTNEELQSTNEELTTSKEEMQSMNEELQTVNHELQAKVDELTRAGNDMKNLLDSTGIATLFLDNELNVRGFTPQTANFIKLIPGDKGRPISDIVTDMEYPEMASDVRGVLRTLVFVEKAVATRDGRWFQVRIMPYRTHENVIDGVVITFIDITGYKKLDAELVETKGRLEGRAAQQRAALDIAEKGRRNERGRGKRNDNQS